MTEFLDKWFKRSQWLIQTTYKMLLRMGSNHPYISGDNVAKACDVKVNEDDFYKKTTRKKIIASKSIFVDGHNLNKFVHEYRDHLSGKILVSGNSDMNFFETPFIPDQLRTLYCQNLASVTDSRCMTLPIGIENLRLARSGFKRLHKTIEDFEITTKVLVPPMSPSNSVRGEIVKKAKALESIFDVETMFRSKSEYFKLVRKYKFVFVCEGNGFDTHRLWEVLYQNSYPVILKTEWALSLKYLELPILFVSDLDCVTNAILMQHHEKYSGKKPIDYPQLWMPYWENLIKVKTRSES